MNNAAYSTSEPSATEPLAPGRRSWLARLGHLLIGLLPGIALIVFWQWAAGRLIKEIYISKPTAVAQRLYEIFASKEIYPHLWTTGQELVLGYVIGVALGVIGGYALGRSPRMAGVLEPYVMAFYGIPKIALAPLFIIWFGFGFLSKIVMVFSLVVVVFILNTMNGLREVDRDLIALMRTMCATRFFIFRKVQLPSLVPWVFAALRISIGLALIGSVLGELLGANRGLGWYIEQSGSRLDTTGVFAGLFVLMIAAVVINELVKLLELLALGAGRAPKSE